jgi:hypothetical protein
MRLKLLLARKIILILLPIALAYLYVSQIDLDAEKKGLLIINIIAAQNSHQYQNAKLAYEGGYHKAVVDLGWKDKSAFDEAYARVVAGEKSAKAAYDNGPSHARMMYQQMLFLALSIMLVVLIAFEPKRLSVKDFS